MKRGYLVLFPNRERCWVISYPLVLRTHGWCIATGSFVLFTIAYIIERMI